MVGDLHRETVFQFKVKEMKWSSEEAFLMSLKRIGMNVPKYLKMMIIEEAKEESTILRSPNKIFSFKRGELQEVFITKKKEEQTFVYIFKSVTGKLKCVLLNAVNKHPIFTVSAFSEFPFLTFSKISSEIEKKGGAN